MWSFRKPLRVRVRRCCEFPILYTVQVEYLVAGFIYWDSIVGTGLTFEEVQACIVPKGVPLWGEVGGPEPIRQ